VGDPVKSGPGRYQGASGEVYFAWQKRTGKGDVVLDFGCGSGATLLSLACGRRIGVDINPAARREAASEGIEVHESIAEIPQSSVDVVISNHALEHVSDPFNVCCGLLALLVPGGRLVMCLPFDDWRTQRSFRIDDRDHHLYTWTPQLIGNVLTDAGFEVVSSKVQTHAWPPGWEWLDTHLSNASFDRLCAVWSRLRRRRQVIVHARRPDSEGE
jgi:SAM-dependent methyltransferase